MTGFYVYSNLNPRKLNLPRLNYLQGNILQYKHIYKVLFKTKLYRLTLLPKYSAIQKLVHSDKKKQTIFCVTTFISCYYLQSRRHWLQ